MYQPTNFSLHKRNIRPLHLIALTIFVLSILSVPAYSFSYSTGVSMLQNEPIKANWKITNLPIGGFTIGDRINLQLEVSLKDSIPYSIPELPVEWGPFEVRQQEIHSQASSFETYAPVLEASLILWAPGEYQTPRYKIIYTKEDNQQGYISIEPISIIVNSVITGESVEKRGLKSYEEMSHCLIFGCKSATLTSFISGIFSTILILLTFLWMLPNLYPIVEKSDKTEFIAVTHPAEQARAQLQYLESLNLISNGMLKEYYAHLSIVTRNYLGDFYGLPFRGKTTRELIKQLTSVPLGEDLQSLASQILEDADRVKFAGFAPDPETAKVDFQTVLSLIDLSASDWAKNHLLRSETDNDQSYPEDPQGSI
jgi:hypothetical protein